MSKSGQTKLYTLDAVRAIAAFAVAAFHSGMLHSADQSPYLAVDFFFALSGFVIAYSYDARLESGMGAAEFIRRRLLRLYPLFALGLVLGLGAAVLLMAAGIGESSLGAILLQFICGLLFLPYPSFEEGGLISPLNGPYWSLILEIHINILFALAFTWLSVRVLGAIVAVAAAALIGIAYTGGTLETGFLLVDYFGGVARVGFSFGVGILLCRLRHRIPTPRLHWGAVLALAAFLLVVPTPIAFRGLYDSLCVLVLFPLLILAGARTQPATPGLTRLFVLGGGVSYALYAIHTPIFTVGAAIAERLPDLPYRLVMLPCLAVACVAAVAADLLFDQPVRKALGAWLDARRTRLAAERGAAAQVD